MSPRRTSRRCMPPPVPLPNTITPMPCAAASRVRPSKLACGGVWGRGRSRGGQGTCGGGGLGARGAQRRMRAAGVLAHAAPQAGARVPTRARCAVVVDIRRPLERLPGERRQRVRRVAQAVLGVEGVLGLQAQAHAHVLGLPLGLCVVLVRLELVGRPQRVAHVLRLGVAGAHGAVKVVPVVGALARLLLGGRWGREEAQKRGNKQGLRHGAHTQTHTAHTRLKHKPVFTPPAPCPPTHPQE